MILVADILPEIQSSNVLGNCSKDDAFRYLTRAVRLLANKAKSWRPLEGYVDLCVRDNCVTLPHDVLTPIAININGQPALAQNEWYGFHMNGLGDTLCGGYQNWQWMSPDVVCFQDTVKPSLLVAVVELPEDSGKSFRVYGYDQNDHWIQTRNACTGEIEDGMLVPMILGWPLPYDQARVDSQINTSQWGDQLRVKTITRVTKPVTKGFVRLVAWDEGRHDGTSLIGYYWPNDTEPRFKRIKLNAPSAGTGYEPVYPSTSCEKSHWVRMLYRRKTEKITSVNDLIPLHSPEAIINMVRSLKLQANNELQSAEMYEQKAVQYITEEQDAQTPTTFNPIQVAPGFGFGDMGQIN